jgi:hypothetical protein
MDSYLENTSMVWVVVHSKDKTSFRSLTKNGTMERGMSNYALVVICIWYGAMPYHTIQYTVATYSYSFLMICGNIIGDISIPFCHQQKAKQRKSEPGCRHDDWTVCDLHSPHTLCIRAGVTNCKQHHQQQQSHNHDERCDQQP